MTLKGTFACNADDSIHVAIADFDILFHGVCTQTRPEAHAYEEYDDANYDFDEAVAEVWHKYKYTSTTKWDVLPMKRIAASR